MNGGCHTKFTGRIDPINLILKTKAGDTIHVQIETEFMVPPKGVIMPRARTVDGKKDSITNKNNNNERIYYVIILPCINLGNLLIKQV